MQPTLPLIRATARSAQAMPILARRFRNAALFCRRKAGRLLMRVFLQRPSALLPSFARTRAGLPFRPESNRCTPRQVARSVSIGLMMRTNKCIFF